RRPLFYNFTLANDHQLMTEGPDHRQVVADKQITQIVPALQVPQQLDHLALHRTIQRRGRLIQQDQRRLEHQCPGYRNPLTLPAGKLVRVAVPAVRIQAHFLQRLDDHLLPLLWRADAVDLQSFADDLRNRHARTQTAEGVLEYHLELPPGRAYCLLAQAVQPLTVAFYQALALDEAQQRQTQCGLAGTALADDAQRLPRPQAETGVGDRLHVPHGALERSLADREPDPQLFRPHHHRRVRLCLHRRAGRVRRDQLAGVFMLRVGKEFCTIILFDDLSAVHDTYSVRNFAYQIQIVTDQQQCHAQFLLQILQQFEDLLLHGDVQRGSGLVGTQQFRLVGQRHGNHHPLALAAGQFVGKGAQTPGRVGDADQLQQLQGAGAGGLPVQPLVQEQHLADLPLDIVQRVQRRHRLLKDHRDAVAAHLAQLFLAQGQQVLPLIEDPTAGVTCLGVGQQTQDGVGSHGFAGAALTDQGQGLAGPDVETDAAHRLYFLLLAAEGHAEIVDPYQWLGHVISSGRRHRAGLRR